MRCLAGCILAAKEGDVIVTLHHHHISIISSWHLRNNVGGCYAYIYIYICIKRTLNEGSGCTY